MPSNWGMMKILSRIFDFCASLELAIFLILAMAVALSAGTICESKYGAAVASQLVYRSWWMQAGLWLFMVNLAAVAISRLPWKKHHVGFLITHLGIIILLLGSWITQLRGVDGALALAPGEAGRMVRLDENMLYVFRTVPGKAYDLVLDQPLNFDLRKPMENPVSYSLRKQEESIKVLRYYPKATREVMAEDVKEGLGVPALKIRLFGSRASFDDWLFLQPDTGTTREIGPAQVRFLPKKPDLSQISPKASLIFFAEGDPKLPPRVVVAKKGERYRDLGRVTPGKVTPLGWMDFSLVVDSYHASAIPRATYSVLQNAPPNFEPFQVVEVELGSQKLWLELGASGQIPVGDALYYVQFNRRQVDLGFDVKLKNFSVGFYEGTNRPKSYSSLVEVLGKETEISMNEPLHHGGFTFYQASYEANDAGEPVLSVLSVNYDPGRWVKYLGSLMLVCGIISMFYFKPKYSGSHRALKNRETV